MKKEKYQEKYQTNQYLIQVFYNYFDQIHPAIKATIKNNRINPTIMIPIIIFLFFHHMCLLVALAVLCKS